MGPAQPCQYQELCEVGLYAGIGCGAGLAVIAALYAAFYAANRVLA